MKTTVFPRRTKSFLLVKLKFLSSETKSSSRWNKKFFLMKLKCSADETVVSCRKNKHILSSCSLKIFTLLDFILGISIHILVTTLAIKSLGFQQIAHRTSPCRVIISIQTQVFRSLFYGFAGNLHLLVSVIQIIPGLFHPQLLKQSGVFRANQEVQERVMDSNDIERERVTLKVPLPGRE